VVTGRITKAAADGISPGAKDKLLWDEKLPGFGLKVTPAGAKVFIYQYRLGGRGSKVRRYTIGRFGALTADGARKQAERLAMSVAQGADPQRDKGERRRISVELAFDRYLERFVEGCLKVKWKSSHADAEGVLRNYALPVFKDKPLPDIGRADIRAALAPLEGRPPTKRKLFAVLRRLFNWALSEGDLSTSPLAGMEAPATPMSRDRVLTDDEIVWFWQASLGAVAPFGPLVRMLLLTGARREEVAGMIWSEVSQADAVWTIPAGRAKNGLAVDVPLSALAIAEISALASKADKWPKRGLLFSTNGKTAFSGFSKGKTRLDKKILELAGGETIERWTLHDLRRTLATGMQRLGVRFEVTEAILNHVSGSRSGVAGIYQRHHWGPEKKAALRAWSEHIAGLLAGAAKTNVVQLGAARARAGRG
jgi:integrase